MDPKSEGNSGNEDDGSETARLELDEIINVVHTYYKRMWKDQAAQGVSPSIPNFHRSKVQKLSVQLGVSEHLARLKFAQLARALKQDAVAFWSENVIPNEAV